MYSYSLRQFAAWKYFVPDFLKRNNLFNQKVEL